MQNSTSLTLIILTHLLIPSILASIQSTEKDLIDQTCKQTPFYDLCLSSLQSNPESSNSDVKGLANIIAEIVLDKASDTLNFIEGLVKEVKDEQLERSLAYCAELYIPVVKYSLPQAIEALSKGKFGFAVDGISDAAKEADACEKKFSGVSSQSPLADRNGFVHKLCDVAVAILNMLL